MFEKNHRSVAAIVAKGRIEFFFSQRLRQQKNCETRRLRGMLHWAIFRAATCVATKLRDNLQDSLPRVTPLLQHSLFVCQVVFFLANTVRPRVVRISLLSILVEDVFPNISAAVAFPKLQAGVFRTKYDIAF